MRIAAMHTKQRYRKGGLLFALLLSLGGCAHVATTEQGGEAVAQNSATQPDKVGVEAPEVDGAGQVSDTRSNQEQEMAAEPVQPVDESVSPYLRRLPPLPKDVLSEFEQAVALLQQGDEEAAKQRLLTLEKQCSSCSGVLFNLGLIYRNAGDFDAAKHYLIRATEANGDNLEAWNELAILYREAGEFLESERCYQQALQRWESYPVGHLNLAILYELYMGRFDEALIHYRRYQQLIEDDESIDAVERRRLKGWIALLQRQLQQAGSGKAVSNSSSESSSAGGAR